MLPATNFKGGNVTECGPLVQKVGHPSITVLLKYFFSKLTLLSHAVYVSEFVPLIFDVCLPYKTTYTKRGDLGTTNSKLRNT